MIQLIVIGFGCALTAAAYFFGKPEKAPPSNVISIQPALDRLKKQRAREGAEKARGVLRG